VTSKVSRLHVAPKTTWEESALSAEVRRVVATEIRMAGLVADPRPPLQPPADVDAEQELISLLVNGHKTPADLRPLRSEHFFARMFQLIWEAAETVYQRDGSCEIGGIGLELKNRGFVGRVLPELEQIRDCTPAINDVWVQRRIARVMELALRRRLIDELYNCDVSMRADLLDADGVRARLNRFFAEVLG
jgi:hypothetical protein